MSYYNVKHKRIISRNSHPVKKHMLYIITLNLSIFLSCMEDEKNNDPRLIGVSSASDNNITVVKKGTFTSCKKNDGCTPWSIKAKEIKHDKTKKQLIYDHAILNVYDVPVMYFPKFFHPDPSVERQSGFLKPQISESEFLGSSFYLPYYWVISDNKDYTFKPTIFDSEIKIFQNEYRQENEYSSFITDFSLVKGYQSSLPNSNRNSISHLFSKFNLEYVFSFFKGNI